MVVIDNLSAWLGFGIGVGLMIIIWITYSYLKGRNKYSVANFQKLIYDSGVGVFEAKEILDTIYPHLKELEKAFQDIDGGGG